MLKISRARVQIRKEIIISFLNAFFCGEKKKKELINRFETAFAGYIQKKYAISVSSGKMALYLSLKVLGAIPEDEIIVPAYTVTEVIDVIVLLGLCPIFVDINLDDATMNVDLIRQKISDKTKFILMTHMYGCPADVDAILELGGKFNLAVIEDAAQACGAEYKGKKTGGFGKVGYFSFGIFKNLNALGGGMIVTDDDALASKIRNDIKDFSCESKTNLLKRLFITVAFAIATLPVIFSFFIYPLLYIKSFFGKKGIEEFFKGGKLDNKGLQRLQVKFSAEQAAVGISQLKIIDDLNNARISNANILNRELSGCGKIGILKVKEGIKNIYLNYVIRLKERGALIRRLFSFGIDASPGQVVCCADKEGFKKFFVDCPNSRLLENEHLYIPIHPPLGEKEMIYLAGKIRGILK